jgi:hypothetical protein
MRNIAHPHIKETIMDTSSSGPSLNRPENKLFEFQQALLGKEIEYIHSQISHFDDLSFQIKGWAVAIWSAIATFGAQQNAPLVVLASIPAIATFWILDGFFKQYQRRLMSRAGVIARVPSRRQDYVPLLNKGILETFHSTIRLLAEQENSAKNSTKNIESGRITGRHLPYRMYLIFIYS